jgi:hypothetical protein
VSVLARARGCRRFSSDAPGANSSRATSVPAARHSDRRGFNASRRGARSSTARSNGMGTRPRRARFHLARSVPLVTRSSGCFAHPYRRIKRAHHASCGVRSAVRKARFVFRSLRGPPHRARNGGCSRRSLRGRSPTSLDARIDAPSKRSIDARPVILMTTFIRMRVLHVALRLHGNLKPRRRSGSKLEEF